MTVHIPTTTFVPGEEFALNPSRRQDGWSAANQRKFLEAIAEGHGVDVACAHVGLSATSAYAFRRTAKGAAFALGWRAAALLARDCVAETLMVRALEGQVDTVVRADGTTITRHRHDNRLAMALLARLDRQAEDLPDADAKAARLVAQEFDAFLGLVERDEGAARAGLFLARRADGLSGPEADAARDLTPIYALAAADRLVRTGVATAAEVDIADLDPAARGSWTAEQWQRAEAAGLLALAGAAEEEAQAAQRSQHSVELDEAEPEPVWWDEEADEWRTAFPPPEDFCGVEMSDPAEIGYERSLTDAELALVDRMPDPLTDEELAEKAAERDAYFAGLADGHRAPPPQPPLSSVFD